MRLAVLGCGLMGTAAVYDLTRNNSLSKIIAADVDVSRAVALRNRFGDDRIEPVKLDVDNLSDVEEKLVGTKAILGAIHYRYNYELSKVAIEIGAHFCDLGGNNSVVDEQMTLSSDAQKAGVSIIPDCGLAPGMVSVVVAHGMKKFDTVHDVRIRVGGLPHHPKPPLNYKLVFSVEGLINEYIEPVRAIRDGRVVTLDPLTDMESLSFPAPFEKLEAFTTSGGTSTLVSTLLGRVNNLDYKTIRYPGHCEKMKLLLDLGFFSSDPVQTSVGKVAPRALTGPVFERALTNDDTDCVLVQVEIVGLSGGSKSALRYRLIDHHDSRTGLSAMMRTTAFPAIIISQMQADGRITARGTVPQELAVPPEPFMDELAKRGIVYEVDKR